MPHFTTFTSDFFKQSLMLTFLGGGLVSCETVVDIELPQEPPRLVVNYVTDAKYASSILLTQSQSVLDNTDIIPVLGAKITLQEEGECTILSEKVSDCCVFNFREVSIPGRYSADNAIHLTEGKTSYY